MNELTKLIKPRDNNANKGTFGRALLICGSYTMAGAAIIAADACIKSGIGICDVACEDRVYPIVSTAVPEAVFTPLSFEFNSRDKQNLKASIKRAKCVVIGCGMGNTEYTDKILQTVLEFCEVPLIIDADGLNVLSKNIELLNQKKCEIIITPHPGEMGRLINKTPAEINEHRIETATEFSKKHQVVTLLKGHNTVISDTFGEYFINKSGNSGMATGGSGDCLSGIIAALICDGLSPYDAACVGAYIHGLAGDKSAKKYSKHSTSARTMLNELPNVFLEIENEQ